MRPAEFNEAVLKAIDSGVSTILGESGRHAVYYHIRNRFRLNPEDFARRPNAFVEALHSIFGAGAGLIERQIVRSLKAEFQRDNLPDELPKAIWLLKRGKAGRSAPHPARKGPRGRRNARERPLTPPT